MADENKDIQVEEGRDSRYYRRTYRELRRVRKEMRRQHRTPPPHLHNLFWGLLLVLWGVLIFAVKQDWLTTGDLWKGFITGLGGIFLLQSFIYALTPSGRIFALGRVIPGVILVFVGLNFLLGLSAWWPVTLTIAGLCIIFVSWFLQREIEKRKVTQETLRESEVKYRHIIDNANSVIMEMDTSGNITFVNKFALDFFGFREDELLNHNVVATILAADSSAAWFQMIQNITTSPKHLLHSELSNRRKNGEKVWMVWTYQPIMDDANRLKEVLCIGIDMTQQKQAEELAAREMREKTAMEERNRLARDLHDAVSQTLFSTSLIAEVLPRLWEKNHEAGLQKLDEVRQLTRGALAEMRTLLFELRPAALAGAELNELLRQLAESVTGRARVPVTLNVEGACDIPADVKVALYRIAQEALNNIAKHSGAARGQVILRCQPGHVTLQIIDNGRGFDPAQTAQGSFGLSNMKERAAQINAVLKIESKIDEGTEVTVDWQEPSGEARHEST